MPTLIVTLTCKTGITADLDPGDLLDGEWCLLTDTGLWVFGLGGQNYYAVGPDLTAIEALTGTGYAKRTGSDTWTLTTPAPGDLAQTGAVAGNSIIWNGTTWAPANVDYSDLDGTPPPPDPGDLTQGGATDGDILQWDDGTPAWLVLSPDAAGLVTKTGTQSIAGAKTFEDLATFEAKVVVEEVADDNTLEAGSMGLWSDTSDLGAVTHNAYFDTTDWRRREADHAEMIFLGDVVISFNVAGTDSADSVITWETPLELQPSRMILGGTDYIISTDTADASDTKRVLICGGGSAGSARGATLQLAGNESAISGLEDGSILLDTGAVDDAFLRIRTSNGGSGQSDVIYAQDGQVAIGITAFVTGAMLTVYGRTAVIAGGAAAWAMAGGVVDVQTTDVGNVTTGEDDLHTYTVPASALMADEDSIEATYVFTTASHGTDTRRIRAYFGGTQIYDSGSSATTTADSGEITVLIVRESSTVVRCSVTMTNVIATFVWHSYTRVTGLTLSATNVLKITGEGVSTNDIIAKVSKVRWDAAAA